MKTNRAPFSDVCELVTEVRTQDASGYDEIAETRTQVFCSISVGVTRSEFYAASKAGIQLSATALIWEADYAEQSLLIFGDRRYKIIRVYPDGHGYLELSLQQEVH